MLDSEILVRMSFVAAIYEGLARLFGRSPEVGLAWLSIARQDAPFNGATPLDYVLSGGRDALQQLRWYVDDVNGGPPGRGL